MSDEWGPWIEHDGQDCPCRGMYVHVVYSEPDCLGVAELFGVVPQDAGYYCASQWVWHKALKYGRPLIIRYRIRKPRALADLQDLIADLPAPVQPEAVPA